MKTREKHEPAPPVVAPVVANELENAVGDPDLARVVERWLALPERVRRAVLALVDSAQEAP